MISRNIKGISTDIIIKVILLSLLVFFFDALTSRVFAKGKKGAVVIKNNRNFTTGKEPAVTLGAMELTIGQAIKKAVEMNHDIIAGSYDVAMADTYLKQFNKKYAIFLNADGGVKYEEYPGGMQTLYGKNKKSYDVGGSIAKMFSSGTTVSAGIRHEYSNTEMNPIELPLGPGGSMIPIEFGMATYYMPVAFVSIQQELLKNSFGYGERRQKIILSNMAKMQKDGILFKLSMVVTGVIMEYWNVIINKSALKNAETALRETKKVRNITARNVRLGLSDSFNLNYYNVLVAGAEAQVENARQAYRKSLRSFLTTVNLDENLKLSGRAVFTDRLPDMDETVLLKTAYGKRADYQNALLTVKNAKLEGEITGNESMPSLTARLNVSSLTQNEKLGASYGDTASMSYPSYEARLKMSYPLNDSDQKVRERNARFKLKQAKIQLEKTKRTVKDDIINSIEQVKKDFRIYTILKKSRKQSQIFYRKMLASMRKGRLSSAMVKNGVDALVQSRNQEIGALVMFNISLLKLKVATNTLWESYEIDVDKYIPKSD